MATEKEKTPTFAAKRFAYDINSHRRMLTRFNSEHDLAVNLDKRYKIFLDANFLLEYHKNHDAVQKNWMRFYTKHKDNLIISAQVQKEYIRNREKVIRSFFKEASPIKSEFSAIKKSIDDYFNNNLPLKSYNHISKLVEDLTIKSKHIKDEIDNAFKEINRTVKKEIFDSEFLTFLSGLSKLDPLPDPYLDKIKKEFKSYSTGQSKFDSKKEPVKAYPGCADDPDKLEPEADYIIYHEMLHYAIENDVSVILLTYDNTKGDWMQAGKDPHIHYVDIFHQHSDQLLFILDAERTMKTLFRINKAKGIDSSITDLGTLYANEFYKNNPYKIFGRTEYDVRHQVTRFINENPFNVDFSKHHSSMHPRMFIEWLEKQMYLEPNKAIAYYDIAKGAFEDLLPKFNIPQSNPL